MKVTEKHNERIAKMIFASFYPHYVTRIEKHGRTQQELEQVVEWLTGYNKEKLEELLDQKVTVKEFYEEANIHPNAHLIKGVMKTSLLRSDYKIKYFH